MKNFFSLKLYKEGLSQLRLMGFLTSFALIAAAVVVPVIAVLTFGVRSIDTDALATVTLFIFAYAWVAPLVLSFTLFSFLNSRRKSDFYHALPVKRTALFGSFTAAVLTWTIITALLALIVSTAVYASLGVMVLTSALTYLGAILPAIIFATSAAVFAQALSGTRFTSIVIYVLFIALPPLLKALFAEGVTSSVPSIPPGEVFQLGTNLFYTAYSWVDVSVQNILYTLAYAAVFFAAAAVFFLRRRSEVAGSSAISAWVQWLCRIALGFLTLVFLYFAYSFIFGAAQWVIVSAVVTTLVLLAFELISTRRIKNIVNVLPALAASALSLVAFITLVWGVAHFEARFSPQPSQIQSFTISNVDEFMMPATDQQMARLLQFQRDKTPISDDQLAQLLVAQLDEVNQTPSWGIVRWDSSNFDNGSWTITTDFNITLQNGQTKLRRIPVGTVTDSFSDDDMNWSQDVSFNALGEALAHYGGVRP
ncbi:MAG: hypothetical protein FWE46_02030 [Coriobacteriia bacterium]|nr:hypothetical protein [Coriobacteriia bacterium]MCL2537662.1 hypothetical protein [Coriobacteriia bacterium]